MRVYTQVRKNRVYLVREGSGENLLMDKNRNSLTTHRIIEQLGLGWKQY